MSDYTENEHALTISAVAHARREEGQARQLIDMIGRPGVPRRSAVYWARKADLRVGREWAFAAAKLLASLA
jgi:hypothetical protein